MYHIAPAHRPYVRDAALAAGLGVAGLLQTLISGYAQKVRLEFASVDEWHRAILTWWVLTGLILVGLAIQHRWPVIAFGLAAAGATGYQIDPRISTPLIGYALPIVLYTLASLARSRWIPWCALAIAGLGNYLISVWQLAWHDVPTGKQGMEQIEPWSTILITAAGKSSQLILLLVLAYALGDGARTRRAHLRTVEQRAADLEREQAQRAELATAAERGRITRELHDVVAHGLSVMVVQAQGAAAALHRHPDRTETALRDVIATGRGSLAEMRRLLGVVRGEPRFAPQPGVGTLPVLVDQVRAAGTPVAWRIDGTPVPLPAGVDLSAYRIVQEALTNTRKHAGTGAAATVALTFHPDRLEIDVADDGPGPAPISGGDVSGGDGSGLRGIAERVAMLGGALSVGPRAGGGFGVRAVLPLDDLPGDERRLTSPAQVLAGDPEPAGSPA